MNLDPGKSYTLTVNMKYRVKFAASNIYWDEQNKRLTFDEATGNTGTHQQYQGVYFKWGSLVGFSPFASSVTPGPADQVIYVPTYNGSNSSWTKGTISSFQFGDFDGVPYIAQAPNGHGYGNNYLATCNNDAMYQSRKGDICQYLGKTGAAPKGYRMPSASEFLPDAQDDPEKNGWEGLSLPTGGGLKVGERSPDGKSVVPGYLTFKGIRFPFTGDLDNHKFDVDNMGCYWSGSASSNMSAFCVFFQTRLFI
jgi:hypothetical protein